MMAGEETTTNLSDQKTPEDPTMESSPLNEEKKKGFRLRKKQIPAIIFLVLLIVFLLVFQSISQSIEGSFFVLSVFLFPFAVVAIVGYWIKYTEKNIKQVTKNVSYAIAIIASIAFCLSALVFTMTFSNANPKVTLSETYEHDGFYVKYPSGWETKDSNSFNTYYVYPPENGMISFTRSDGSMSNPISSSSSKTAIDDFFTTFYEGLKKGDNPIFIDGAPIRKIDGDRVYEIAKVHFQRGNIKFNGYLNIIPYGPYVYSVFAYIHESPLNPYHQTLKDIAESAYIKYNTDTSKLDTVISKANSLDSTKYTADSYSAVISAVSEGKKAKFKNDQAAIDAAIESINSAIASLKEKPKTYSEGTYKIGSSLPPGEYLFTGTSGYVCVYPNSTKSEILENANFNGQYYMTVFDGQVLTVNRATFISSESRAVTQKTAIGEGMYKVGVDIPAGEYNLKQTGSTKAYYCVYDSSLPTHKIINNNNFSNSDIITVSDGQYLSLSRCTGEKT